MTDTTTNEKDSGRRSRTHREYRRAYKACNTCRKRKSRCEISAEEYAAGLPCSRCRRELKPCAFPATVPDLRDHSYPQPDPRRASSQDLSQSLRGTIGNYGHASPAVQSHQRPTADQREGSNVVQNANSLVSPVMRTVVSSGDDALNILFKAAQAEGRDLAADDPELQARTPHGSMTGPSPSATKVSAVSPSSSRLRLPDTTSAALDIWRVCRFVKQGWFSAAEAILLVDMFFQNLAPFTPILTSYYQDHANHYQLITKEPVLCCIILTISSRYNLLPGMGNMSRSYMIHERLWDHCQHLILRIMLGQEKGSDAKTRTLRTIQALLLLTEWNPRRMHFPPPNDGWDSDLLMSSIVEEDERAAQRQTPRGRWLEDVINPARRSGRMSWMILGSAMSLAFELGILDEAERFGKDANIQRSEQTWLLPRVRKLLYLYGEQLASRLGLRSMIPQSLSHGIFPGRPSASNNTGDGEDWQICVSGWMELSRLTKSAQDMLFPSPAFTTEILQSGRYVGLINHFQPLLSAWQEKYIGKCASNSYFSDILLIEYQSARIFTNALGLQAVVERTIAESSNGKPEFNAANQFLVDATDYGFIQEVVDASLETLRLAIRLAETGRLMYAPVRIFLRLTSASIHLLKGIGIGVGASKLRSSLQTLNRCISCLRTSAPDDMHLGTAYATLLEMHVNQLQERFIPTERPHNMPTRPPSVEAMQANDSQNFGASQMDQQVATAGTTADATNGDVDMSIIEEWLTLPFDSTLLPFEQDTAQQSAGWVGDASLDFIWNLQY